VASKVPAAAQTLQILALLSHIDVPISAARIQAELVDSDLLDKWLLGFGDDIWDIEKIPL